MNYSAPAKSLRMGSMAAALVILVSLGIGVPQAPAFAVKPKPAGVAASWKDAVGLTVTLRNGTWDSKKQKGFGWAKVKAKHGLLKYQTVKHPTLNPRGPKYKGSKRTYVAYATRYVKNRIVEQFPVYTVVETGYFKSYWGVALKSHPGVLTTYCDLKGKASKCPKWVDTAFSKKNNGVAKSVPQGHMPDATGSTYGWSYTPGV
ncbi:hypothetical protein EDF60_1257 [Leucobacter luti]|uniref:hypothetical protein n=1 Tax=Leucobacter luti TaxID=340320 RepID=UPI00104A845C|nr:hypothetical protein [Leucobacter luti]MCW2287819.1 hypothetical protein [Leucobacter luti]TCK46018.1 hypothetical protein EDF60_1257 [Leucobacter luti]